MNCGRAKKFPALVSQCVDVTAVGIQKASKFKYNIISKEGQGYEQNV